MSSLTKSSVYLPSQKLILRVPPHRITRGCLFSAHIQSKLSLSNDSLWCRLRPGMGCLFLSFEFLAPTGAYFFFFPSWSKPCRLFLRHIFKCYILSSSWVREKPFRQGVGVEREKGNRCLLSYSEV